MTFCGSRLVCLCSNAYLFTYYEFRTLGPMPDPATGADMTPASEIAFIKAQAPQAKYVMSVCVGSFILAHAGVLSGKRATTNKSSFKIIEVCLMGASRISVSLLITLIISCRPMLRKTLSGCLRLDGLSMETFGPAPVSAQVRPYAAIGR